jgi:polyisoprenoid-binding protein YceI
MTSHTIHRRFQFVTTAIVLTGFAGAAAPLRAAEPAQPGVEIRGGTAAFDVGTNIPAISIHGKSTSLAGRARIQQTTDGLVIEDLQAVVPVRTLNTGLDLRDEHMRKYVFTTADGGLPDLRFSAERAVCAGTSARTCQLSGTLVIRDMSRPFTITLKVDDKGGEFRAAGDGVVKLSAYGIPVPSQLGVSTMDDVKLHVDFVVRRVDQQASRTLR